MIRTGYLLNRTRAMAKQIVMDITGDTRHEFDPIDAALRNLYATSTLLPRRRFSFRDCEAVS